MNFSFSSALVWVVLSRGGNSFGLAFVLHQICMRQRCAENQSGEGKSLLVVINIFIFKPASGTAYT